MTPRLTVAITAVLMLLPAISPHGIDLWRRSWWTVIGQAIILLLPLALTAIRARQINHDDAELGHLLAMSTTVYFLLSAWGSL